MARARLRLRRHQWLQLRLPPLSRRRRLLLPNPQSRRASLPQNLRQRRPCLRRRRPRRVRERRSGSPLSELCVILSAAILQAKALSRIAAGNRAAALEFGCEKIVIISASAHTNRTYNRGMRRLHPVAAFVLLVALVPVSAQMRGGAHASSGGHGGCAGRGNFGGHVGGGHVFGRAPSGRGFSGARFQSRGFSRNSSFHQANVFRGDRFRRDRSRGDRFGHRRFRNFGFGNCFGCSSWGGWPWWYSGYYDPYWYWDSHSSYDEDRERELQTPEAPGPGTVLVFRDQHKLEVQNYAIVGQTLWNFTGQRTQKIPLAELDLTATAKANDERGVDFRVPGAGEGQ